MNMKRSYLFAFSLVLSACSAPTEALRVKQFILRDLSPLTEGDPMILHEKNSRLHGAVTLQEREERLGQYITVLWDAQPSSGREILFRYRQGSSRIKEMRRALPAEAASGREEFNVIGKDYLQNGRILAWKLDLLSNGVTKASKQSYLWE
jgi:hypothetical protein